MTQHTSEAFSVTAVGWTPLVVIGTAMPPRNPDEDDEDDEEDEEDEEDEGEDGADEPAVVREPDED